MTLCAADVPYETASGKRYWLGEGGERVYQDPQVYTSAQLQDLFQQGPCLHWWSSDDMSMCAVRNQASTGPCWPAVKQQRMPIVRPRVGSSHDEWPLPGS